MTKKYADVRINVTVCFEDDESVDQRDQAIEAAIRMMDHPDAAYEVVGKVRDTEALSAMAQIGVVP